jgi:hypothetical protein
LDYFSYKNGPNDLVRGLFSSLDVGTYILPICRPLGTFLIPLWGAQMPQNSMKDFFWFFQTISPTRMGLFRKSILRFSEVDENDFLAQTNLS